jgi:outer membrane protein TolC
MALELNLMSTHIRTGRLASIASLAAASLLVAGCTVGPNYQRPSAPVPPAYKENGAVPTVPPPTPQSGAWKPAQPADDALRGKWWELYGDPQLNTLEDKIAVSNQTLKAAAEQYLSAREQVRVSRAAYYPTLSISPNSSQNQLSQNRPARRPPTPTR